MSNIIWLVVGVVIGYMVARLHLGGVSARQREGGLISEQGEEKDRNMERILGMIEAARSTGSGQGRVTNDEIQEALGVSDATATRYLDELERQGKIRQVGNTGKSVFYEKI